MDNALPKKLSAQEEAELDDLNNKQEQGQITYEEVKRMVELQKIKNDFDARQKFQEIKNSMSVEDTTEDPMGINLRQENSASE